MALRRTNDFGADNSALSTCVYRNARRARVVPVDVVQRLWAVYQKLTVKRLYELEFDLVVSWNATTSFTFDSVTAQATAA